MTNQRFDAMSQPRFYLPPAQTGDTPELFLAGREAHHALRVLRLREGDRIVVLNGAGDEFRCEIRQHDRDKLRLVVIGKRVHPPPLCRITLLQALPKGKLIESIIQKATELGAARVIPLLSERVVVHFDAKEAARKAEKWQTIAVEAIKQCGAPWLPEVATPMTPAQFLARREQFDLPLIASLQPGARQPRDCFRAYQSEHQRRPQSTCVWIGPEGDFSPAEIAAAQAAGALPITLGPLTLRTETAAIYCLSILNYELQAA